DPPVTSVVQRGQRERQLDRRDPHHIVRDSARAETRPSTQLEDPALPQPLPGCRGSLNGNGLTGITMLIGFSLSHGPIDPSQNGVAVPRGTQRDDAGLEVPAHREQSRQAPRQRKRSAVVPSWPRATPPYTLRVSWPAACRPGLRT